MVRYPTAKRIVSPMEKLPQPTASGLYLVSTPIGNMGDITLRALDVLRAADFILCEDTRVTGKLLAYYDIKKPLRVYNNQSEQGDSSKWIQQISEGAVAVLVSDAGTPLVSDPGFQLVRAAYGAGVRVTTVPGANAVLSALQLSGLPSDAFFFGGFLPTKTGERKRRLESLADIPGTLVFYERAERVTPLLADVIKTLGDRPVAVVREITKLFEDARQHIASKMILDITDRPIKGEVVVLIDRAPVVAGGGISDTDIQQAIANRLAQGDRMRAAVDHVAERLGCPRRRVYDLAIQERDKTAGTKR
jgi:16S rRNA (cytidine1402-2'-O)-methyltransferase